jgi:hypothetical protein
LGGPLLHVEHPRRFIYPAWREDLGERPPPEEINELAHPATPLGLTEAMSAVLYDVDPSLDRARVEFSRDGILIALGCELTQDGLLDLGRLVGPGSYIVAGFDAGARLMKAGRDSGALLTPYRIDDAVDWVARRLSGSGGRRRDESRRCRRVVVADLFLQRGALTGDRPVLEVTAEMIGIGTPSGGFFRRRGRDTL